MGYQTLPIRAAAGTAPQECIRWLALNIAARNMLVSAQERLEGVRAFAEKRAPCWSGR
ncbi:MAG: hypothetical protein ACO1PB_14190 [Ramlibacter sp.]